MVIGKRPGVFMGVCSVQDTVVVKLAVGHGASAYPNPIRATQPLAVDVMVVAWTMTQLLRRSRSLPMTRPELLEARLLSVVVVGFSVSSTVWLILHPFTWPLLFFRLHLGVSGGLINGRRPQDPPVGLQG